MRPCYDVRDDRIVVVFSVPLAPAPSPTSAPIRAPLTGLLDVGDGGHLLGLEVSLEAASPALWTLLSVLGATESDRFYLELDERSRPRAVRTLPVSVEVRWEPQSARLELSFPRRTEDYEFLFPVGST
ncbi:MAG: hypothetical protein RMJ05_03795 [Thermomicrobium sp.]|nr:hypothetical protein [Thermomicrobium sp.]MDW8005819.1 hypothetical protein [Thermomicrobium sp.]